MDKVLDLRKSAAKYNPRKITKSELDRLKKALEEFGDLSGIVFNRRTGRLVGGHQRCKVMPQDATIEITKTYDIPTRTGTVSEGYIIIDGERYTYREVDWDETKEKAANIAANAHGGDWDEEKLHILLKELTAIPDFDLDLTGFDLADIHQIIGDNLQSTTADKLMTMAEQLRSARETFREVQKNLEQLDEVLDCYLVVIFKDYKERKKFTDALGLPDNRYIDARKLLDICNDKIYNNNI